jgi:hypothetical protein
MARAGGDREGGDGEGGDLMRQMEATRRPSISVCLLLLRRGSEQQCFIKRLGPVVGMIRDPQHRVHVADARAPGPRGVLKGCMHNRASVAALV